MRISRSYQRLVMSAVMAGVIGITGTTLVNANPAFAGADVIPEAVQLVTDVTPDLAIAGVTVDPNADPSSVDLNLYALPPATVDGVTADGTDVTAGIVSYPKALANTDVVFGQNLGTDADALTGAILFRLRNAQAAPDVSFTIDNPDGTLALNSSGGVNIIDSTGAVAGTISPPWALDAIDQGLPTTFTVSGNTVTQHVNTTTAVFPVVADPHWTWGWVTGTVYFNKHETSVIAASLGWIAKLGIFIPGIWGTIIRIYAEAIHEYAKLAKAVGGCVKFKSTGAVGIYFGGYCK
jgi:hypothetical protein